MPWTTCLDLDDLPLNLSLLSLLLLGLLLLSLLCLLLLSLLLLLLLSLLLLLYGRALTMKRSYGGSGIDLGPQLARRLAGARLQKCQKIGGQGGVVRASGEDKDFISYLLLAKRAGGCCFRNF